MKKTILLCMCAVLLFLSACSMEATIPDNSDTFSVYFDHDALFQLCVDELSAFDFDCLISKNSYFSIEGSEDFEGLYLQNMSTEEFSAFESENIQQLMDTCGVKIIDLARKNGITICSFDFCVPGRSYDYGVYYVSVDEPVYLGDVTYPLTASGNGFTYEQPATFGTKFTFYTEKITNHYYYYEIS